MKRYGLVLAVFAVIGCSNGDDDDMSGEDASNMNAGDSSLGGGEKLLVEAPYTVASGEEYYHCSRTTLTEDVIVTRFTPTAPAGVHHTILAIDKGSGTGCSALDPNWVVLFASGIDSPSLDMPPGVGFRLPAGTKVVLALHLYNATDTPLSETAAMNVLDVEEGEIEQEAEVVLIGPLGFTIPPNAAAHDINASCNIDSPRNFFAVFPHMHQRGRHIKVWADKGDTETVVHDLDYEFEDQAFTEFEPMPLVAGDDIHVTCTYENTTSQTISFGDSSDQEMCFAISYWYPKRANAGGFGSSFCF